MRKLVGSPGEEQVATRWATGKLTGHWVDGGQQGRGHVKSQQV